MKRNNKSRVAFLGMLVAVAFVLSYIESLIPFLGGIYGIKLGLANLAVVVALYCLGYGEAFQISIVRVILVGFTFGNLSAMAYSFAGGILSFLVMAIAKKTDKLSMAGVSVLGGVFHNIGQICLAVLVVENGKLFYYFPVLLISGVVTGFVIGVGSAMIIKRVRRVIRMES